jgi:ribosomal protein S18 acetylase RimI-like enzyme
MTGRSSDQLIIRDYEPDDHAVVVGLNRRYGLAAAGVPEDADIYSGDLDDIAGTYQTGRSALIVGDVDGLVVAMGGLREVDEETCEILRMRVHPAFQGRGFGRMILDGLETRARSFGYRRATLVTSAHQVPAVRLYANAGFRHVATEHFGALSGTRLENDLAAADGLTAPRVTRQLPGAFPCAHE